MMTNSNPLYRTGDIVDKRLRVIHARSWWRYIWFGHVSDFDGFAAGIPRPNILAPTDFTPSRADQLGSWWMPWRVCWPYCTWTDAVIGVPRRLRQRVLAQVCVSIRPRVSSGLGGGSVDPTYQMHLIMPRRVSYTGQWNSLTRAKSHYLCHALPRMSILVVHWCRLLTYRATFSRKHKARGPRQRWVPFCFAKLFSECRGFLIPKVLRCIFLFFLHTNNRVNNCYPSTETHHTQ